MREPSEQLTPLQFVAAQYLGRGRDLVDLAGEPLVGRAGHGVARCVRHQGSGWYWSMAIGWLWIRLDQEVSGVSLVPIR